MRRETSTLKWMTVVMAALLAVAILPGRADAQERSSGASVDGWIVSPAEAESAIAEGDASILDARGRSKWEEGHVEDAVPVDWKSFTPKKGADRGSLLEDDGALGRRIRSLGVDADRPVVVVGAGEGGWGESGRIVWMLRTLGHDEAAWVDGGAAALAETGVSVTQSATEVDAGEFEVDRRDDWTIERDGLRDIYRDDGVVLLDTREAREYRGKTPYGESRGGHIPGAKHLHFKELLDSSGRLKSRDAIRSKLREIGVSPDERVVTYCTGGVRSAWVASVLIDLGYSNVQNYAGSTWEWSGGDAETYPLDKE